MKSIENLEIKWPEATTAQPRHPGRGACLRTPHALHAHQVLPDITNVYRDDFSDFRQRLSHVEQVRQALRVLVCLPKGLADGAGLRHRRPAA